MLNNMRAAHSVDGSFPTPCPAGVWAAVYDWARNSEVGGLFAWTWVPRKGKLRLLGPDSDFYGSQPTAWGRSWKGFSFGGGAVEEESLSD